MRTVADSPIVVDALERIRELSAAVWEVRGFHEPVPLRRWPYAGRPRLVCRTCRVPHPCPTWRTLQRRRVAGCAGTTRR